LHFKTNRQSLVNAVYGAGLFVISSCVVILSIIALSQWKDAHQIKQPVTLSFKSLKDSSNQDPQEILNRLAKITYNNAFDPAIRDNSFWFLIKVPQSFTPTSAIEIPSRRMGSTECWDSVSMLEIGNGDRSTQSGLIQTIKSGFYLSPQSKSPLLCHVNFSGPPSISFIGWQEKEDLEKSALEFERKSSLLEGGMLMLIVFSLVAAALNGDSLYMLFAVWLMASLRIAAISAGWDFQWFGHEIPANWILPVRQITYASYYALTAALFTILFKEDIKQIGKIHLLETVQWVCVPLGIVSLVLSYPDFLFWLWSLTAYAVVILLYLLVQVAIHTRSKVAYFYGTSVAIILFSSVSEVLTISTGQHWLIGYVNHVSGALLSSLLVTLAVAEHLRNERIQKNEAKADLQHTFEMVPVGIFTLGNNGEILRINPTFRALLRVHKDAQLEGENVRTYFGDSVWEKLSTDALNFDGADIEFKYQPKHINNDVDIWLQVQAKYVSDKYEGTVQEVSVRHLATSRLQHLADHDALTNVFNRRGIEASLGEALATLGEDETLAVAYLDLDRFKLINDLYGHVTGDEVLRQVSARIFNSIGTKNLIGRIGGDEFIIGFKEMTFAAAESTCHKLHSILEVHPYLIDTKAFNVKAAIGLVEVRPGILFKDAIAAADKACREAKSSGTGICAYGHDSPVFRERQAELVMIERFSRDKLPDGLYLEMQPIMSLKDPFAFHNFETLIRMRDNGLLVPAGRIISAAESSGNSGAIDRWVLTTLLSWLDENRHKLTKTKFVCMNLSGASLNDERFIEDAFSILGEHQSSADILCVEITEAVALNDLAMTRRFINGVKKYGARIALDDFGAGYTSFSYLRELPADAVKIDGSFVKDVCKHPTNLSIVQTIAELARNLGMQSIAEWAEDQQSVEALAEVGVDYVQGWAIAKAMSPELILSAESSADLIADETMRKFVRESLPTKYQLPWFPNGTMH